MRRTAYQKDRLLRWWSDSGGRSNSVVGRVGYGDIFRHVGIDCSTPAGTESACSPPKFGGMLSDVVSVASMVSGVLLLMFLQSPLLNTGSANPPPKLGDAMTWYVPIMGIQHPL